MKRFEDLEGSRRKTTAILSFANFGLLFLYYAFNKEHLQSILVAAFSLLLVQVINFALQFDLREPDDTMKKELLPFKEHLEARLSNQAETLSKHLKYFDNGLVIYQVYTLSTLFRARQEFKENQQV